MIVNKKNSRTKYHIFKQNVFSILNSNIIVAKIIYGIIIINIISIILESYHEINSSFGFLFKIIEYSSITIFTLEYLLRLWASDLDPKYVGSTIQKRIKFSFSKLGIIDLLAIIPFYLPYIFKFDLRIIRILRLLRLLRVLKLTRYSKSLKTIYHVYKDTRSDLIITIFMTFILLLFSSTLMYFVENEYQPEKFKSIGHSFWWAVATLTTVGYGDVYPITPLGKILSGIIAIIGIGIVALPTGIISSSFISQIKKSKDIISCPNCKKQTNH